MSGQGSRFFGRPRGRFFVAKDEMRRMDRDIEQFQQVYGSVVQWFFFRPAESSFDDVYDEGDVTGGKVYDGPRPVPVLSVANAQGQSPADDQGFITFDHVTLRMAYEQARRAGLDTDLTRFRIAHLQDRFVWRNLVYKVDGIQTSGHFDPSNRDMTVFINATQLRPDELIDSPTFASFSG